MVLSIDQDPVLGPDPGPGLGQDQDHDLLPDQDQGLEVLIKGTLDLEVNPYPRINQRGIGEFPVEVQQGDPAHEVCHLLMVKFRDLLPEAAPQ